MRTRLGSSVVAIALAVFTGGCGGSSAPAPTTYGISGAVSGAVAQGVTVALTQGGATVATQTTAANGAFAFTGLANGSYFLTPSLAGHTFAPATLPVTVDGADVTGQNFTSAAVVTAPAAPTAVTATPGDGQVTVSWSAVAGAETYTVYRSTTSGAGKAGTASPGITGTTTTVTGLANATRCYFVVTAANSAGESAVSTEVSATPAAAGAFTQADLTGTWRFSLLSAGAAAGWKRGTLAVDAAGNVTFSSYADSANAPPNGFLPVLLVDGAGRVRDAADPASATWTGDLGATKKNVIAATASASGTRSIAVFTKHGTATFSTNGDILGFGNSGGGARRFVYDQLTSGAANQEWEFVGEQIGQGASGTPGLPQYTSSAGATLLPYLTGLTNAARPTDRTLDMVVSAEGVVTETRNATTGTPPGFVVESGFMTDDKTMIHAAGTTADGRFALRLYFVMNAVASDTTTASQGDLAGTYAFRRLSVGASAVAASGSVTVGPTGATSYASYADSAGSTSLPPSFGLTVGTLDPLLSGTTTTASGWYGILGDAGDPTLHGKLAYEKDVLVFSRTETAGDPGEYGLTIAVR